MELTKVACDRCKAGMNGSGYYLRRHKTRKGLLRIELIKSESNIPGDWQNHYCGKACLMLALNEMVDEINNGSVKVSEGQSVKDSDTVIREE